MPFRKLTKAPSHYFRWLAMFAWLIAGIADVNALGPSGLTQALQHAAPRADAHVVELAVAAVECAAASDAVAPAYLAVIDYSRPSSEPRLWVFDLQQRKLVYEERVAHGRNSGDRFSRKFSNIEGSLQSSLGLFRTRDSYNGRHGYSLRLDGLEPGINDNALKRAIVMHGAPYVSAEIAREMNGVGRSWGCPAVRSRVARPMIDTLKGGQYLFAYYPDPAWLQSSIYLHCTTSAPTRSVSSTTTNASREKSD